MRLWSIHPKYLDCKGLLALWREGLLARKVLSNCTKGYKNHPQLFRFRQAQDPIASIDAYLYNVISESRKRFYNFDHTKLGNLVIINKLTVSNGQLNYEYTYFLNKLKIRNFDSYILLSKNDTIESNPFFEVINGPVEKWEKIIKVRLD